MRRCLQSRVTADTRAGRSNKAVDRLKEDGCGRMAALYVDNLKS